MNQSKEVINFYIKPKQKQYINLNQKQIKDLFAKNKRISKPTLFRTDGQS